MDTREVCDEYRAPPVPGGFSPFDSFHVRQLGDDACMNCGFNLAEHRMKEWFGEN